MRNHTIFSRVGLCSALLFAFLPLPALPQDWATLKADVSRILPRGAELGILAVTTDGDTLECENCHRMFVPASNLKLLTTGAALLSLGTDFQFRTAISYSGRVNGSTLEGDLYLVGDGDPTIGASYASSKPLPSVMDFIYAQLEEAGITAIQGAVVADGRCYASVKPHDDWDEEDKGFYYGAEVKGINFYENVIDYTVRVSEGGLSVTQMSPVFSWNPEYPSASMPWLDFTCTATVGEKGTGDKLYYDASDLEPVARMYGTLAADRTSAKERCTNRFPEYTFAAAVYDYLRESGISISDGYAYTLSDGTLKRFADQAESVPASSAGRVAVPVAELVTMGRLSSPLLPDIIRETNHESDNLYAEALLKAIGSYFFNSGETSDGILAEKAVLKACLDYDLSSVPVADGCGMSRNNLLTPSQMVDFLRKMSVTDVFGTYLQSLPNPGEGTLAPILQKVPSSLKNRIFMKSGSMSGVRCYSGYILPANAGDKTIVFSIMANRPIEQ